MMTSQTRRARTWAILSMTLVASLMVPGGSAAPQSDDSRGPVLVRAAGRGNPYINFTDGRAIARPLFDGAPGLISARSHAAAEGLALASADFDEDGTPDLVVSSAAGEVGQLALHFGNVDAIRPNTGDAKSRRAEGTFVDAPFLPVARLFATPEWPDFIGAGDFDADGHWDVVTAQDRGASLTLHRGDGAGGFHPHESLPLPGAVTAMATGEINRRDGLTDLVVGVVGDGGAQALVFQAPEGALTAPPQAVDLPAEAVDLALGQMDTDYPFDLVVAAGNHLIQVRGVDRTADPDARPRPEGFPLPFPTASLALGDFDADGAPDLALLDTTGGLRTGPASDLGALAARERTALSIAGRGDVRLPRLVRARVSSLPGDDLIAVIGDDSRLAVVHPGKRNAPATSFEMPGAVAAIAGMRLNVDALEDLVILQREKPDAIVTLPTAPLVPFGVTNTLDSGAGSLRQAILSANGTMGADLIEFSILGAGPHVIQPLTPLPTITDPVTIDGTSEPDYGTAPVVELDGRVGASAHGLRITAGDTTISGLAIVGFKPPASTGGNGILIETGGNNRIEDCYVGVSVAGAFPSGNGLVGVAIVDSPGNQILRNAISGNNVNGLGIGGSGSTMNVVQGNRIGTNVAGSADFGNGNHGLVLSAPDNTVGGTDPSARNVIAGNASDGITILGAGATGNIIQNNYIGTNASGTAAIANDFHGIEIFIGGGNTIGGLLAEMTRNLVSGNGEEGILIAGGSASNAVQGNHIGTNASGTAALPNASHGVHILDSPDNFIGGHVGAGNVISGNGGSGVLIEGSSATGNRVQGDSIGTDVTGALSLPNAQHGIGISGDASNNLIGNALTPPRRNRIGFNGLAGIFVETGATNSIRANAIFSNGALGIDLAPTGVTGNDMLDTDTGPNGLQNFPGITRARTNGGSIDLDAVLNSEPGQAYDADFFAGSTCDATGRGEGARFLGSGSSTIADSGGNSTINRSLVVAVTAGEQITATATHPDGSTSEFSVCFTATPAPGPVPLAGTIPLSGLEMFWEAMAGAQSYNLYRGVETDLPNLVPPASLAPPVNSCLRWSGTSTSTGSILEDVPPPGSFYWYLATSVGIYGESDGGEGSLGTRKLNPSGPCAGAHCPHDRCIEGAALDKTCGACVAQICATDAYCCDVEWDNICVEEARTICQSLACGESKGQCNHTLCSFGPPLAPGCDVPPFPQGGCAAQICAADPFCCEEQWDAICIDEVATVCGLNCN